VRLEKDLSKQVQERLSLYQMTGEVLWYGRLNSLKVKTIMGTWVQGCPKGTPDYIVLVNIPGEVFPLFLELKSEVGTLRPEQKEFYLKYNNPKVQTMILRDIKELDQWIESHAIDMTKMMLTDL